MTSKKTDIIAKFKSELSKVYDGKIDVFHSFSNDSEKVRINNCVYLAWEIGGKNNLMESVPRIAALLKENELINRVPEIIGILNDTKLKSVLLNF